MLEVPKVSVVIPVYNGERYLFDCIQSIYQQSYSNFEIIVVDDASTDGTKDVLERLRYFDKRLRYLRNEKNLGSGGSRNVGIRESKADLVGFLDSDDRWYSTFLETQLCILDSNPDIDCLYCDFDFIDEAGVVTDVSSGRYVCDGVPLLSRVGVKEIWEGQCPLTSTVIIKKAALFEVGLFQDGYCEDLNMWLKLAAVGHSFAETHLVLGSYRKHQIQKTTDDNQFCLGTTEAYQDAVRAYPEIRYLVGSSIFSEVMHHNLSKVGNYWFWMKQDYSRAAKYLWQAYLYKPSDFNKLIKLGWCCIPPALRKLIRTGKTALASR